MLKPQRVYATPEQVARFPEIKGIWQRLIQKHNATVLKNGENPEDYPTVAVAFETQNFGWVLSAPDAEGKRHILEQF